MKRYYIFILLAATFATVQGQERYRHNANYTPTADAVIYLYLDGGSAQTDTFDPKPEAGRNYCGKYTTPIKTANPQLMLGQRLKRLATIADKFSVIRTMTNNGINAHETAHYITLTGDMSGQSIVYPSFGSMISYLLEPQCHSALFPYITLTASSTRFNEAGFLPSQYKPYDTGGAPESEEFNVDGITSRLATPSQLRSRRDLLSQVNSLSAEMTADGEIEHLHTLQAAQFDLVLGDTKEVFNLSNEPDSVRDRYGRTRFGQSCLAARRLVENGVKVVCVRYTGWDTHKEHFARMDERLDDLDCGLSALIEDLDRRGLLCRTIILCGGEFGRTPRISFEPPWNGGRGHYGQTYSYLVAGGGFKGGCIVGKTDEKGEKVVERPVYPCDLIGSVYTMLGIDPTGQIKHPTAGYIPLLPTLGTAGKSGGLLYEIMEQH